MDTDKLQISVFKNNIKAGRYVCGQDLIVEENNDVRLEIYSPNKYDSYIYEAWCDRNDGRNIGITIENGHLLYTNVRGADDFEGKWNCTMLITENVNIRYPHVKDSVQNEINCELNVIVKRYVTLIISDKTDGTNFNVTNDQKDYFYAPGQIVDLKCVKNNETQEVLDSGTMELAICNENAPTDKLCSGVSNSTNRVIELKEKAIKENCIIRCTFKSVHGIETSAEIVLKLKDLKLQKITVDDNNVWNKDDYFLYEVATSESGDSVVKCTKSEDQYYGSLHWEYCGKENEWRTSTCEIHAKKYENMITWPISRQKQTADILKCVYTYDSRSPIRKAVLLIIRVIEPPHISIQNSNKFKMIETQYGYTAEGVVGQSMIVECINRQSNGFIIWSYCKKGKCTPGEKYISTKLQHVFELKMDSNDMKIRCVYISEGKLEINSKEITIRVKKDTKPAGKPASHSTSYNNNFKPTGKPASYWNPALNDNPLPVLHKLSSPTITEYSPETNAPSTERSVSPIHNLIQISRESAYFGEEVNIWCGTEDTEKRTFVITIKPEKGIKFNLKGKHSQDFHSFEANYTMNCTEPLDISCFVYDLNGEKIQEDTIKLNYSEPVIATTESALVTTSAPFRSGSPNYLIIGALGAGILIVIIIIIAIWNAIRKSKAKTKQRKSSVTYENLSNEHQRPTSPFPRGAKLEETYLAPADMQERAVTPEETYAQPFKPTLEDLYSKPLKNRDKPELYTQVLPKHQRKANVSNEVNYAEIEVESKSKANKYANIDEGNYATITDQGYANLAVEAQKIKNERDRKDKGDYTNVFENEPYSNSKSKCDDYAEPSYCQISQFKN